MDNSVMVLLHTALKSIDRVFGTKQRVRPSSKQRALECLDPTAVLHSKVSHLRLDPQVRESLHRKITDIYHDGISTTDKSASTRRGSIQHVPFDAKINLDLLLQCCFEVWTEQNHIEETRLTGLFQSFDLDGDGFLSFEEFEQLVSTCDTGNEDISSRQVKRLFTEASELCDEDDEDDNLVNMDEFRILAKLCLQHGIIVHTEVDEYLDGEKQRAQ